jgi:DedD protein
MAKIDNEDELKRQMRRRLVGAVALVTALVVILPMMLESEPKPGGHDIELRIPDKDKAGAFTSQMVVPESAPAVIPESAPEPVAASAHSPAVPPVAAKPEKTEPAKSAPVKPAPPKSVPAKPEHKAAHDAAPKAGFAVQVGAFANADTAKELQHKLRKQGLHAYTEKAGETVRVRVGTYATREEAESALHKLEAQGLHPAVVSEP